jgi:hypothetical protein
LIHDSKIVVQESFAPRAAVIGEACRIAIVGQDPDAEMFSLCRARAVTEAVAAALVVLLSYYRCVRSRLLSAEQRFQWDDG